MSAQAEPVLVTIATPHVESCAHCEDEARYVNLETQDRYADRPDLLDAAHIKTYVGCAKHRFEATW